MEKAIAGRFARYRPSEKQPRTKDDDENEKDSVMTLNAGLVDGDH
jgi:hypothetical protein